MITVHWFDPEIQGLPAEAKRLVAGFDPMRQADITSLRLFVERHQDLLWGRVLDYGAGKPGTCRQPQPYRHLVDEGAEYLPYDIGDRLPEPPFDAILCTQVLQYIQDPASLIRSFAEWLRPGGNLIIEYSTSWDFVEKEIDLWRFTPAGMEYLLKSAGLTVRVHEDRAEVKLGVFTFPLGYGVIATK